MENLRIIFIDIAKAIAIVLVVIGHYFPDNHPQWYGEMNSIIYGFHMPLFMFASGFVYIATVKDEPYQSFIWRKVKRLLIPYLAVSVLIISIKLMSQGSVYVENPVTVLSYIKVFYLPEAGYFTWFVWALWWMFVMIPFFDTKNKRLALCLIAVLLKYLPIQLPEVFCLKEFKGMLLFFCLGVLVWDYKKIFSYLSKVPTCIYLASFIGINYVKKQCDQDIFFVGANLLVSIIGIAFVVRLSKWIEKNWHGALNNFLLIIASSSYIIYLFHTTFEGIAKAIVFKIPILTNAQNKILFLLGAFIVITCGIMLPMVIDRFVLRRYKCTKMLFGYKL